MKQPQGTAAMDLLSSGIRIASFLKKYNMKNILLTVGIVGAAIALLIYYAEEQTSPNREINEVEDAAEDAYNTMNKHIRKVERAAGDLLDPALG